MELNPKEIEQYEMLFRKLYKKEIEVYTQLETILTEWVHTQPLFIHAIENKMELIRDSIRQCWIEDILEYLDL